MTEAKLMKLTGKTLPVVTILLAGAIGFTAAYRLHAQEAPARAEGGNAAPAITPGMAPGLKITDLGKGARTFRLNYVKGDEIMSGLLEFAEKNHIKNGHFTGLGAIDKGSFRWADPVHKSNKQIEVNEESEIVSMVGSIAVGNNGKPAIHAHMSVAYADGSIHGGHLLSAHVSIISEIFVVEEEAAPAK